MPTILDANGIPIKTTPEHSGLVAEMATRQSAGGDWVSWLGTLPDPDPVLRKRGDGVEILDELTADHRVCSALQTRKLKTLNRQNYKFRPGCKEGEDPTPGSQKLCDALVADMERLDLRDLISEVLDTPYYGLTPVELIWQAEGGRLRLDNAVAKPRRWFGFNSRNQLLFYSLETPTGTTIPAHKFVLARHFPTYDNPYGLRLLSRCLWPVAFKRGGIEFWMKFSERFGQPWILAEAPSSFDRRAMEDMAAMLRAMVQDAVAVVKGGKVQAMEAQGKGEIHQKLVQYWDNAIAQVIMGQTLTSGDGDGKGSYALGQTHYAVLQDYADADEALIVSFFNDLAWTYTQVNAPDEMAPVFEFVQPEDYAARADLDTKIKGLNLDFTSEHVQRHYNLSPDEFIMKSSAQPQGTGVDDGNVPSVSKREFATDLSEDVPDAEGQSALDDLIADTLEKAGPVLNERLAVLKKTIQQAETYDDLALLLAELLPDLDDGQFEDLLHRAFVAADQIGRFAVEGEDAD